MKACVNAILSEKERKHINIHGHKFNCKPITRGLAGRRRVQLSHDQFGKDDQIIFTFRVAESSRYIRGTLGTKVSKGVSTKSFPPHQFEGPSNFSEATYNDIASHVTGIKPVKVKRWQTVANQMIYVVTAQFGWIGER